MHLDPYIIFADCDNCNYLWVTGNYAIRSDVSMTCNHEDRTWDKDSIAVIGNGLRCRSKCLLCGRYGYEYYKLDEFIVDEQESKN